MVGAGSGIAPFRAFVQERAGVAVEDFTVGPMLLFFSCRSTSKDFLYADEWENCNRVHRFFNIDCAFSRDGERKVYVQDRLRERSREVRRLVVEQVAAFYICGSTKMAKDVKKVLIGSLTDSMWDKEKAIQYVNQMKKEHLFQEDTWT
jgi:NADPH-ferrihemoprotein reductase